MTPEEELAEFVEIHLSRGNPVDSALGAIAGGLANILNAFMDAQEERGNWGGMMANLRVGIEKVSVGIQRVRELGVPGFEALVSYAERHERFAMLIVDEIMRLQANESTLILEFDRTPRDEDT
jgi:hypothetical protein